MRTLPAVGPPIPQEGGIYTYFAQQQQPEFGDTEAYVPMTGLSG